MDLSNEIILKDIAGFEERIAVAQDKLAELKGQAPSNWKERKKYQAKRREFEGDVVHINNLIAIARSALKPLAVECDRELPLSKRKECGV